MKKLIELSVHYSLINIFTPEKKYDIIQIKKGVYMKKFAILVLGLLLITGICSARDYTRMQEKELKHANKYNNVDKYFEDKTDSKYNLNDFKRPEVKDPHLMKFGDYKIISNSDYKAKMSEDDACYKVIEKKLCTRSIDNYNAQAKGEDYYYIYRIAEKIIRANKLDYMNWRIAIIRDTENINAYHIDNLITIYTALFDTYKNNEDALAFVIGHELAHGVLGHNQRRMPIITKMERFRRLANAGDVNAALIYSGMYRKYLIDSKNMEYAADLEGAKFAAKAGYNLDKCVDTLSFFNTMYYVSDFRSTHPNAKHRIDNFTQNRKYYPCECWKDEGKYNIYTSDVLDVKLSSDRKSIVISAPEGKRDPNHYYRPEKMTNYYKRMGYMSYKNGEYDKALGYFDKLFEIDNKDAVAYLYASYTAEAKANNGGGKKYTTLAKDYAIKAQQLDNKNKYIKEQVEAL